MQRDFGSWAFAGLVLIVSYAVIQTWTPQYANMYLLVVLLGIILFYFARRTT